MPHTVDAIQKRLKGTVILRSLPLSKIITARGAVVKIISNDEIANVFIL